MARKEAASGPCTVFSACPNVSGLKRASPGANLVRLSDFPLTWLLAARHRTCSKRTVYRIRAIADATRIWIRAKCAANEPGTAFLERQFGPLRGRRLGSSTRRATELLFQRFRGHHISDMQSESVRPMGQYWIVNEGQDPPLDWLVSGELEATFTAEVLEKLTELDPSFLEKIWRPTDILLVDLSRQDFSSVQWALDEVAVSRRSAEAASTDPKAKYINGWIAAAATTLRNILRKDPRYDANAPNPFRG